MNNRDYLIQLGFESNIKELENQMSQSEVDKIIDKWAQAIKNFDEILKLMGKDFASNLGDVSQVKNVVDIFNKFKSVLKGLGVEFKSVNQYAIDLLNTSKALEPMSYQMDRVYSSGKTETKEHLSAAGKDRGYTDVQSARNAQDSLSTYGGDAFGGVTSDANVIKEKLKKTYLEAFAELTQFSDQQLQQMQNNVKEHFGKMSVNIDNDGKAIKQSLSVQLDDWTTYTIKLQKVHKEIDGVMRTFWTRTDQNITSNESGKRNAEIQEAEKLINEYKKLKTEKDKLSEKPDSENDTWLTRINEKIENVTENLKQYGITADKSNGLLSQSTQDASKSYLNLTESVKNANEEIKDSSAKQQKITYDTKVKEYIKDLNKLYEAQSRLQKLEFAGAKSNDLIDARQEVQNLTRKTQSYSEEVKNNSRALEANETNTRKLAQEQRALDNNVNRTGTSFGNFTKRLKESAENTLVYGTLYKSFSLLDQGVSNSIQKIRELDTAMTQIQMVTGQTDSQVYELMNTYSDMAVQLGATTLQVAEGSVEWLRQGKTVEETNKLLTASTMLSKVGMIDAAESTELMTAALNGFKLNANDAIGIVDKLAAVDLAYATSSEEIATALQYVASSAGMANVSLDKMIGLITVVSQTTRLSAEQIGQSFKTIIARMQNIKVGKFVDDETGESLNDVEKTLNKVGIRLRDSATEWRSMEDVIDEVGQRWGSFNDIEKSAITTAMAGTRQRDKLIATFDNYDKVLQATEVSLNSAGTAEEKYADYMESIDAKINQFIATWEKFVNNLNGSGVFAGVVDAGIKLIEILDVLVNKFGLLQNVALPAVVLAGFIKLSKYIKTTYQTLTLVGTAINKLKEITIIKDSKGQIKNIKQLSDSLNGLSLKQKLLVLSTKNLTDEEKKSILIKSGVSKKNAEAALSTKAYSAATVGATTTTNGFTASLTALKAAFLSNPITAIITVITTVISAVTLGLSAYNQKIQETIDKSKELVDAHNSAKQELQSNLDTLKSLEGEFETLSKGVDKNGDNVSLTADEYSRYNEIIGNILEISPSLITGYTEEGKALSSNNDLLKEAVDLQKQKIALELKQSTSAANLWDIQSGNIEQYIKKEKELQKANDEFSSIYNDYFTGGLFGNDNDDQLDFFHNIAEEITGLNQDELSDLSMYHPEEVVEKWFDPLKDNAEHIYNEMTARTDLFSQEDLAVFSAYVEKKKNIASQLEPLAKQINQQLQDVPRTVGELGETYDKLSKQEKGFLTEYINNLDIDTEKLNEQDGEAYMQQVINDIRDLTEKISDDESLKIHFDNLFDTESIGNLNIDDYKKLINDSIKGISESLDMSEEEVKLNLNIDDSQYDTVLNNLKSKFEEAGTDIGSELDDLSINTLKTLAENIDDVARLSSWDEIETRINTITALQSQTWESSETLWGEISKLSSAYTTLSGAIDEYNQNGYMSIETINSLLELDDAYLAALVDENGQVNLNTLSSEELRGKLVEVAQAKAQDAIESEKASIAQNKMSQAKMIDEYITKQLSDAVDDNTEALNRESIAAGTNTDELMANAEAAKAAAIARASDNGVDLTELFESDSYVALDNAIAASTAKIEIYKSNINSLPSAFKSAGSSAKSTTDTWKEAFERAYKDLQYQRDMDLIDAKTYYTQLAALNQKYFAGREKYVDDFQKYNKEVYQGLKKLAEEQMKAEAQAHIDSLDRRIKKLQEEKSALRERNEEEDLALRLQKARDRYEAAKGQLTNRVYTNEKGWTWEVDSKELQDAKEEIEEIEKEISLKRAEQAIDDQIADLERLKEKWQDYMNNISEQLEELGFEIDENGNIVIKNAELAEQGYNQMTGATNNYATAVSNSAYSVEYSLGRIKTAIQSIGEQDFKNLSDNFTDSLGKMKEELEKVKEELEKVLEVINKLKNNAIGDLTDDIKTLNSDGIEKLLENLKTLDEEVLTSILTKLDGLRNGTISGITTELQTLCDDALQKILTTLKDIDAIDLQNVITGINNLRTNLSDYNILVDESTDKTLLYKDSMVLLGEESVTAFNNINEAMNNIGADSLDTITNKINTFIDAITSGFNKISTLISQHINAMKQAAINDQNSFNQMAAAANGFASIMQSVENKVVNALNNIQAAADAAVRACQMAEAAAVRAEIAAVKAADSAVRAEQSAQAAEQSANRAEAAASRAASAAASAASSASSAESSARDASRAASKASKAAGGRAGGIEMGAVDWTGLTMLHGTPSNPEYVLTSQQMENFVKNMSRSIPSGRISNNTNNETTNNENGGNIIIKDCTFPLNNVREPRDFTAALKQIAKQNRR